MIELNEEKILAMMVVDDRLGEAITGKRSKAGYLRGWILENRTTGEIRALYRFCYANGQRNWYEIRPKEQANKDEAATHLRVGLEDVFSKVIRTWKERTGKDTEFPIEWFYPPDDKGDVNSTLIWLEMMGLGEITKVERIKSDDDTGTPPADR